MENKTSIIGALPFRRVEDSGVMFDSNDQGGACLLEFCGEEIFCFILLLLFISGIIFSIKYVTKDSQKDIKIDHSKPLDKPDKSMKNVWIFSSPKSLFYPKSECLKLDLES